jgi:D-alanyl-D-alanine carboxypeptidase/D-alanyl-D-alanine-endopeptidase (penicillin-binding protein 4)
VPDAALVARIEPILASAPATVAVCVIELPARRELYARDADRPMRPASNLKLVTAAVALDRFGPDHRFETRLAIAGDDLYLIGGGDPGLGDPTIAGWSGHKPTDDFAAFADALRARGLTRIKGNLYYDDRALDEQWTLPTWDKSFREYWYAAPVAGLNFNDNCMDVTVHPTTPGRPVRFEVMPPTAGLHVINQCVTGAQQTAAIHRGASGFDYVITGQCARTATLASKPVENPGAFTADAFRTYLGSRGITIDGQTLRTPSQVNPRDVQTLATHGTSMADLLKRMNKSSQNFFAEALDKLTGQATTVADAENLTSWQRGERGARSFLERNGIDANALRMADGSGLSRDDRVTARLMTDLLAVMAAHPHAAVFRDSLPIAGTDGTLRKRLSDLAGRIRAKTGSIGGVRTLSGYATTVDGRVVAFSILANDIQGDDDDVLQTIDEIARAIAK